jgi:hypothetical protein
VLADVGVDRGDFVLDRVDARALPELSLEGIDPTGDVVAGGDCLVAVTPPEHQARVVTAVDDPRRGVHQVLVDLLERRSLVDQLRQRLEHVARGVVVRLGHGHILSRGAAPRIRSGA